MARRTGRRPTKDITRYTYDAMSEPRTPETGHTSLLPSDDEVVRLSMDNGWTQAVDIGQLETDHRTVVVDLDPILDPILFWSGKRNQHDIPVLPLQRNEIVTDSRITHVIERARQRAANGNGETQQLTLFAELERTLREADRDRRIEFYTHNESWKNKLICGDSLEVMESLLHFEGLRGQVQMMYIDPPYGIAYNSNFQQRIDSTRNDERDRADDVLAIKAYRDTWTLGIHSYLSYLQERLYLCRELLTESGSVFVQINVENVHLVRSLLDEVFGAQNHFATIAFNKTTGFTNQRLSSVFDCLLWYAKDANQVKYRQLYQPKAIGLEGAGVYNRVQLPDGTRRRLTKDELEHVDALPSDWRIFSLDNLVSQGAARELQPFEFEGRTYYPSSNSHWKTNAEGLSRLAKLRRIGVSGKTLRYVRFHDDFPVSPISNMWLDTGTGSFTEPKIYAVQTGTKVIGRCIAMSTDPGDLVFDPTCGSGTSAFCAERLGRRWITCDTSRVSINVARQRLLSAVFDHYKLTGESPTNGFTYQRVNHVTLKSLAQDLEAETVDLIDQPEVDSNAIRVTGPFEVMTLGRYSVEDWKGYMTQAGKLENYIGAICRLYRSDAAIQSAAGFVHAVAESEEEKVAISVGPLQGRVTARQINDAVQDALALGILDVHVLGWAFETNVGEVKSQLEVRGKVQIHLIMIRPDTLADGLKNTDRSMLFSPLGLPDVDVSISRPNGEQALAVITLKGVGVFDRKLRTTGYYPAESGYIAAWYLDEDYDGDCFVDSQMFFDFAKVPNLKTSPRLEIDPGEYRLQLTSQPFPVGSYKRIAVKAVDIYGNESTVVKPLD